MADAKRDNNYIPAILAVLDTDGSTLVRVKTSTAHILRVSDGTTGSDLTGDTALRDNNRIVALMAVSEVDGTTPVPLYANSSGELLIDSN